MFRAVPCSSSGGQTVLLQPLVSSRSVNGRTVCRLRADSTIYMLHYNSQHVSKSTLLIFRRTNCINTASGIVTLCKRPYSMQVESRLTPLDEWSARHRDLCLTTHNTHNRQKSMPPVGFEPTIPASEGPKTRALELTAAGIGSQLWNVIV